MLFLNFTIEGNEKYKSRLDSILKEAVELTKGHKSIYDISKDDFYVIVNLKDSGEDYLRSLDIDSLTRKDYINIKSILEKSTHLVA